MNGVVRDYFLLAAVVVISLAGIVAVPKDKRRAAQAVLLFHQLLTWVLGLWVVQMGWLSYPVRGFARANATSYTFEYLAYPMIAIYFTLYYPAGRSWYVQAGYYAAFAAGITVPEVLIEKYTELITYSGWTWYWTFLSVSATLFLARCFSVWFADTLAEGNEAGRGQAMQPQAAGVSKE